MALFSIDSLYKLPPFIPALRWISASCTSWMFIKEQMITYYKGPIKAMSWSIYESAPDKFSLTVWSLRGGRNFEGNYSSGPTWENCSVRRKWQEPWGKKGLSHPGVITVREGTTGGVRGKPSCCIAGKKHSNRATVRGSIGKMTQEGWSFQKHNSNLTSRTYSWEEEKKARTEVATHTVSQWAQI